MGPAYKSVELSLWETHYTDKVRFVGMINYLQLFTDPQTIKNLWNSVVYVLGSLVITLPFAFLLALVLNQPLKFRAIFRSIIIMPWAIAQIVVALLWKWLLDPVYGPASYKTSKLSLGRLDAFGNPNVAMGVLIMANVWRIYPQALIFILAALQTIPNEIYEASKIDGASAVDTIRFITLPLISATLLVVSIILTLDTFNMVTLIFILTGGGPLRATEVLSLRLYRELFEFWNLGHAATLGVIMFACNVIFSILYISLLRRSRISL